MVWFLSIFVSKEDMEGQSAYIVQAMRSALEETKRDFQKTITDQIFEFEGILQGDPGQCKSVRGRSLDLMLYYWRMNEIRQSNV